MTRDRDDHHGYPDHSSRSDTERAIERLEEMLKRIHAEIHAIAGTVSSYGNVIGALSAQAAENAKSLAQLKQQGENIMAVSQEIKAAMARIDAATNAIAAKLAALADKIATSMSQADVDEVKAGLTGEADKLEAMASNPENPVPTP